MLRQHQQRACLLQHIEHCGHLLPILRHLHTCSPRPKRTVPPLATGMPPHPAGKRPVTIWMPVSPPGYTALGAVVRGEPEVPATGDYLCIR